VGCALVGSIGSIGGGRICISIGSRAVTVIAHGCQDVIGIEPVTVTMAAMATATAWVIG